MEWILGILGAGVVLWIAYAIIKHTVIVPRRNKARHLAWQNQQRTKWVTAFNDADTDTELSRLSKPDDRWVNEQITQAYEKVKEAKVREEARVLAENTAEATAFYDRLRLLTDPRERWELLREAPHGSEMVDDGEKSLSKYIVEGMKQYANLLLDEARAGNAQSFFELTDLVTSSEYDYEGYRWLARKKFKFPQDWDELVTTFYKNPSIEQFKNQPDYAANEILLVATEAMRTQNFIVAKLVLAYSMESKHHRSGYGSHSHSQKYWPYRAAIGDFLLTELAAFVDGVHVQRGLFQDHVAVPVVD